MVGQYAIQLAKWNGATVIATVSTDKKAEICHLLGADFVANYKRDDLVERVKAFTDGAGVDRIVEVELAMNIGVDHSVLKSSGVIAAYASDASDDMDIPFTPLVLKCSTIHFVGIFFMPESAHKVAISDLTQCMEAGILRHPICDRFSFEEIVAAHEASESGNTIGKNVVEVV